MMTQPLATVKARFSEIVTSVQTTHERVVVTRNGQPAVVLIAPDDLEALEETLAVLSDPELMASIQAGEEAVARGDVYTEDEVRRALANRRRASIG